MTTTKPLKTDLPFPYPGSKVTLLGRLSTTTDPPPHTCYVVPFGGSAAEILAKPYRSKVEVYNDVDSNLYTVFHVLQDPEKRDQLLDRLIYTLHSRQEWEYARSIQDTTEDEVEKAWATLVLLLQSRVCSRGWQWGKKANPVRKVDLIGDLRQVAARFARVQVENDDWETVIDRYDTPETLFSVDPPYLNAARDFYVHEFTEDDHRRLLKKLNGVAGMVVLFGYRHPIYDTLVAHWQRRDYAVKSSVGNYSVLQSPNKIESVWFNFNPSF